MTVVSGTSTGTLSGYPAGSPSATPLLSFGSKSTVSTSTPMQVGKTYYGSADVLRAFSPSNGTEVLPPTVPAGSYYLSGSVVFEDESSTDGASVPYCELLGPYDDGGAVGALPGNHGQVSLSADAVVTLTSPAQLGMWCQDLGGGSYATAWFHVSALAVGAVN